MADEIYKLLENLTNALEGVSGDLRENALLDKEMAAVGLKLGVKAETVKKVQDADKALGGSGQVEPPPLPPPEPPGLTQQVVGVLGSIGTRLEPGAVAKPGAAALSTSVTPAAAGPEFGSRVVELLGQINESLKKDDKPAARPDPQQPAAKPAEQARTPARDDSLLGKFAGLFDRLRGWVTTANVAVSKPEALVEQGERRSRLAERLARRGDAGDGFFMRARGQGQQALGHALAGLGNPNETRAFGNFLNSAGALAGMIPGVGKPLQALAKLGEVVLTSVDRLQQWNSQLREADLRFAEFSASMIAVQVQSDIRYMNLSRERGERRAFTADMRERAAFQLDKTLAPIQDASANIKNVADTVGMALAKELLAPLTGLGDSINKMFPEPDKNRDLLDLVAFGGQMDALHAQQQNEGRPSRFRSVAYGTGFLFGEIVKRTFIGAAPGKRD